jgi:hypothetical protein
MAVLATILAFSLCGLVWLAVLVAAGFTTLTVSLGLLMVLLVIMASS